ncbi:MAG: alpha/beta fold hydrolase [Streptosporangiaceae bacterium]|nr:alpha/beta fold hydrolase [Streptosporangiaceae bacterium]
MGAHDGLFRERRGSGPPFLVIPGASGGSAIFASLADALAERYTVLTYDRRGHARSGPDAAEFSVASHAADARAVIADSGLGAATVLGISAGAIIGLDLAARFPEVVSTVVAHEPPLYSVLPRPRVRTAVRRTVLRVRARRSAGAQAFLTREMRGFHGYDAGQLSAITVPVVLGAGQDSRGNSRYRISRLLADRLGARFAEFPGGHRGAMTHPGEFAATLIQVLDALSATGSG